MSDAVENFTEAFGRLIDQEGVEVAAGVIAGAFVSLMTQYVEARGLDASRDLRLDGGESRDITIHAPKQKG